MKLSEAIMMNGMCKPQGFGANSLRSIDAPCAIGGALQSINEPQRYFALFTIWPWTEESIDCIANTCPACGEHKGLAGNVIWHLNDIHLWTRTQIAEWVASVEPPEEITKATVKERIEESFSFMRKAIMKTKKRHAVVKKTELLIKGHVVGHGKFVTYEDGPPEFGVCQRRDCDEHATEETVTGLQFCRRDFSSFYSEDVLALKP